ncbi:MAG: undecaprenyl-diphosphate phosphatase [Thermoleophilia bacterium]
MNVLDALVLGVVQGATEFLPVSSSGHLVLIPEFFNIPAPTLGFDILVHLATLVAVVGYFMGDVVKIVVSIVAPKRMERTEVVYWRRLFLWLVIGTVPAALAGVLFGSFFEGLFSSTLAVGIFLVVTCLLLTGADAVLDRMRRRIEGLGRMRAQDALIIGFYQALAIAPGVSRSGATICAGIFLGFDRPTAARFSFLLSIPVILGAFLVNLGDISMAFAGADGLAYVVGAISAAVSGFLAVSFLMRYLSRHRLRVFAVYTAVVGVIVIVLSLI